MKLGKWVAATAFFFILNCGKPAVQDLAPKPEPEESGPIVDIGTRSVKGTVFLSSKCPDGSVTDPIPMQLDLFECPIPIEGIELSEPLRPWSLQVDCKKKTIDIEALDRSVQPATWAAHVDGRFSFNMDGGIAKIKNDGAGHVNCELPLTVEFQGQIDCQNQDSLTIKMINNWYSQLDVPPPNYALAEPSPSPSLTIPSPNPSPSVSQRPFPNPLPSISARPSTLPSASPLPPVATSRPLPTNLCQLPKGCFLQMAHTLHQCKR